MKLEHVALNVADPAAMADWYAENLGMQVVLAATEPPQMHFVEDYGGGMLELYHRADAPVPNYDEIHPGQLHIAFASDDIEGDHARLLAAGATPVDEIATTPEGHKLVFMRDPWGTPIQFVQRSAPLV